MVAVNAISEIAEPRNVIQRIYSEDDAVDPEHLPSAVAKHFSDLFLSSNDHQLPSLDVHHPPESYTSGTLVRFRAMIQDTSFQSEMYLARLSNDRCGGWGIQHAQEDCDLNDINPDCLGTASILWAVSVPGQSPWRAAEVSRLDQTSFPMHQPSQPHKFPVPGAPHIGVRVKIYDNVDIESLHSADVVTFVGIVSSECLRTEDDSSPEIPVLHALCYQVERTNLTPMNMDASVNLGAALQARFHRPGEVSDLQDAVKLTPNQHPVRTDLIDWISTEALGGDSDAAEWVLLQLSSKVHTRSIALLPPSLAISRFPKPSSVELLPTLSHVLAELLSQYLPIPLSLDLLNKTPFLPESKEEDLHSGYLQLPSGTTVLLTESAIQEGKLLEKGIMNVQAIQDVINSQTVDYIFPFSSRFTFHTDLSMIVLSEGRKSTFFQTSINLPLRCPLTTHDLYKPRDEISLPTADKIALYRSYIAACKAASEKVQVTDDASKHIQDDFVRRRQQDKSVTQEELIHLLKVARLLAASRLQNEVTIDVWEQARELDRRRQAR